MTRLKQLIELQSSENKILRVKNCSLERENKNLAEAESFHCSDNNPPKGNEVTPNNNNLLQCFDKSPESRTSKFESST